MIYDLSYMFLDYEERIRKAYLELSNNPQDIQNICKKYKIKGADWKILEKMLGWKRTGSI